MIKIDRYLLKDILKPGKQYDIVVNAMPKRLPSVGFRVVYIDHMKRYKVCKTRTQVDQFNLDAVIELAESSREKALTDPRYYKGWAPIVKALTAYRYSKR